jgi:hypothetical protein
MAGCGSSADETGPTGAVTIQVNYGGEPVAGASVQIVVPGTAKSAFADLDEVGSVSIPGVQTGTYTVSVMPPAPEAPDPEKPSPPQTFPNIPQKFRTETTSPLKAEVKEGDNSFEFDLKE